MKRYTCVIFDMDGTVTRTNRLIFDSFNHVAAKYLDRTLTPAEVIALFGPPEEGGVRAMIGPERLAPAMEEYYAFYRNEHARLAELFPGMTGVFDRLKRNGVIVGLFTGKGRRTTDITLDAFGIGRYFDVTVTGDDVDEYKPSGDGIRKILGRFALRPDETLMVGDAVADFTAARESGTDIASVLWDSYAKEEVLRLPSDHHFHSIDEFDAWLRTLYP